ncbi:MAG: acyl-CoA dehydrogenase family protein [Desulfomonilaceae bacterium]|jgi:alkylation response protein AidB-like acyl-CoA dehydrogenase
MDFDLSEEQRMLKESARHFLSKECPKDLVRKLDESDEGYSSELWQKMAALGWMGLVVPEEYGGIGGSFLDLAVLFEEMGYNICPGPFFSTVVLGGMTVLIFGREEQKIEFLPKIARGEIKLTLALTELSAICDASSIQVTAALDNDEYVIRGTKLFVPDANVADYFLCVARTEEGINPEDGLTIFLVDAKSPGIECTLLKTLARDKQCEIVFNDVRVTKENVLGRVNLAWTAVIDVLEKAALARCAEMIGGAQAVMDMALLYARERTQFNHPIGSFQAIQHYFANMWMDINGSRFILYKAAWKVSELTRASKEIAMAKARIGGAYRRVTSFGHQIFAGIGFTKEHDMHLYHRRSIAGDQAFGDQDFQRKKVARELGL